MSQRAWTIIRSEVSYIKVHLKIRMSVYALIYYLAPPPPPPPQKKNGLTKAPPYESDDIA